ncbi:hypothetical protein [Symmachiella dynata]|nr:hypothetical protein [Symmachiella dynata]
MRILTVDHARHDGLREHPGGACWSGYADCMDLRVVAGDPRASS